MRTHLGTRKRLLMLLTSAALFAVPVADAFGAPKARLKFASKVVVVSEGAGVAELTVTRARQLSDTVTVQYTTSSTSAAGGADCTSGVDYKSVSGVLTFAPGETSQKIQVPICDDSAVESGEFVNVSLAKGAGAIVSGGPAQVALADDDGPARIAFASTDTLVFENGGPARLSVIRLGDPTAPVSVQYTTSDGTATADDYTAASGTLNFPGIATDATGATLQTIDVGIVDDASHEAHEDLSVALSSSSGTPVSTPSQSRVTIVDDDSPASVYFADATATVGEAGDSLTVTLRRNGAPGDWVSASYATMDGTALAGSDFASTAFDATEPGADPLFAAGDSEVSFEVPITNDSVSEGDEVFGLALSDLQSQSGTTGVSVRPTMSVTITDDEPAPATDPVADTGSTSGGSSGTAGTAAPATSAAAADGSAAGCGLRLRVAKRQRVARRKAIVLTAVARRACAVKVRAAIKTGKPRSAAVRTKLVTKRLAAGKRTVVRLRVSKRAMRSIAKALGAKRRVSASLRVRSAGSGGKAALRTLRVRLAR